MEAVWYLAKGSRLLRTVLLRPSVIRVCQIRVVLGLGFRALVIK